MYPFNGQLDKLAMVPVTSELTILFSDPTIIFRLKVQVYDVGLGYHKS